MSPPTREEELKREGWERRTTYDDPRLSEMVETYKELGFEVHLEPFHPEEEPLCTECMLRESERFKTIYTRKKSEEP
jgi:hypothetical protein